MLSHLELKPSAVDDITNMEIRPAIRIRRKQRIYSFENLLNQINQSELTKICLYLKQNKQWLITKRIKEFCLVEDVLLLCVFKINQFQLCQQSIHLITTAVYELTARPLYSIKNRISLLLNVPFSRILEAIQKDFDLILYLTKKNIDDYVKSWKKKNSDMRDSIKIFQSPKSDHITVMVPNKNRLHFKKIVQKVISPAQFKTQQFEQFAILSKKQIQCIARVCKRAKNKFLSKTILQHQVKYQTKQTKHQLSQSQSQDSEQSLFSNNDNETAFGTEQKIQQPLSDSHFLNKSFAKLQQSLSHQYYRQSHQSIKKEGIAIDSKHISQDNDMIIQHSLNKIIISLQNLVQKNSCPPNKEYLFLDNQTGKFHNVVLCDAINDCNSLIAKQSLQQYDIEKIQTYIDIFPMIFQSEYDHWKQKKTELHETSKRENICKIQEKSNWDNKSEIKLALLSSLDQQGEDEIIDERTNKISAQSNRIFNLRPHIYQKFNQIFTTVSQIKEECQMFEYRN